MNSKRPLVWILASYLAGLVLHSISPFIIIITGCLAFLMIILWICIPYEKRKVKLVNFCFLLSLPFLFFSGYTLMNHQLAPAGMDSVFDNETNGNVSGQLEMIQEKGDYAVLTLKNNKIMLNQSQNYYSRKLTIYTSSKVQYKIGNILSVSGRILKFQKASNPGQFNEYQYNKMRNIDYKMNAESIDVISHEYSDFYQFLYTFKKKLINVYQNILPIKNAGILSAMILGEMTLLDPDIKELYQQSGISHILAISGLNVSLLGLSLFQFLRHVKIPLFPAAIISAFLLFSYGILTDFSVSTNRAVVMLIILMTAGLIGRTYDLLSAASLSALVILIQSPLQLWNTGFLLSFGAILGIALINPVLSELIPIKNLIWDGLKISISIQIMTLPVILYFFFEFPPYSVLINLIILPSSSIIILLALTAGILGFIYQPLGVFFIGGVHYILNFYEAVCRIASKLPGKAFLVGRPAALVIITYYLIILLFISINLRKKRKLSIILLSFLGIILVTSKNITFNVTFLDVGQGDGIFIMTPKGTTYFIDGGSTDVSKVGQYRLEPFLKAKGVGVLDYAIVTHLDSDHVSGLKELIEAMDEAGNIKIRHLILPNISRKDDVYEDLVSMAASKGIPVLYIEKGDVIQDGEVTFTCMHPAPEFAYSSRNAYSTVLSVNYKQFDLLLTGDLEAYGEELVLKELEGQLNHALNGLSPVAADYDVLKVAHHGSGYSSGEDFLNLIKPEFSIISCGKDNSYGHPHKELLSRLEQIGGTIKITYECGAVTVKTDGEKMEIYEYLKD